MTSKSDFYKTDIVYRLELIKNDLIDLIERIDQNLLVYEKGSLVKQGNYYYLKQYKDGKIVSKYLGNNLTEEYINNLLHELKSYKTLKWRKRNALKELNEINKMISKYSIK